MNSNDTIHQRERGSSIVGNFFRKFFLHEKLNNWVGYLFILLLAISLGWLITQKTLIGLGFIGIILGLSLVIPCLLSAETGLYINLIFSFFAFHISRLFFQDTLPVGVIADILIVTTFLSFILNKIGLRQSINKFSKHSVVLVLLIIYCYAAIQFFNPYANSFNGWYQAFRKIWETLFLLFIAYNVFNCIDRIRKFIAVLFILCTITGIYGCLQQWHGLFGFEMEWATADPTRFGLMFIEGNFRKFSTMSDPTEFGIVMSACSVFFIIVATLQKSFKIKLILLGGVIFMLLGMGYSGTRTANAMLVGGLLLFMILTFHKRSTQFFSVIAVTIFMVLLFGPFSNATLDRFRTTFTPDEDESFNVREKNRKFIQPYIYSHPIGGGLGTTGGNGITYNPGHYLAGFPCDSGYLKKALELGWIGLILFCVLDFLILKTGIRGYFSSKNPMIQMVHAGCTSAIFCFYLSEFAQEAIGQITDINVYYPFIAILLRLKDFD